MAQAAKRKVFDGRYEILSIVGRGSASVVYHARHINNPTIEVALKVLINPKDQKANVTSSAERLRKEALALVSSRHKYVVRLDDFHSLGELAYLALEFAPESDLRKYANKIGGKIGPIQGELFLLQSLEALGFVHQAGLVHRDIKPDNILVVNEKEIRLADFGVALLPGENSSLEELQRGIGTMSYMAPEVLEGKKYDARSDIYGLAVAFYEMLTGVHPFENAPLIKQLEIREDKNITPLSSLNPSIPAKLSNSIMQAMSYEPARRFATTKDFIRSVIGNALAKEVALDKPSVGVQPKTEPTKKEPTIERAEAKPAQIKTEPQVQQQKPEAKKISQPATSQSASNLAEKIALSPADAIANDEPAKTKEAVKPEQPRQVPPKPPVLETNKSELKPAPALARPEEKKKQESVVPLKPSAIGAALNAKPTPPNIEKPRVKISEPAQDAQPSSGESLASRMLGLNEPKEFDSRPDLKIAEKRKVEGSPVEDNVKRTVVIDRKQVQREIEKHTSSGRDAARIVKPAPAEDRRKFFVTAAIALVVIGIFLVPASRRAVIGTLISDTEPTTTVATSPLPLYQGDPLTFPNLPAGVYSGTIEGLFPGSTSSLTLVSMPQGEITVIVGLDGWSPATVKTETPEGGTDQQPNTRLTVRANGFVIDMTGQSTADRLIGNFKNIVTGDLGRWSAKPVLPQAPAS